MTSEEMHAAVLILDEPLTDIAQDINRLSGMRLSVADLSRMKRGATAGGRDPSPVVAVYLRLRLEQLHRDATDLTRAFQRALEAAGLRLVRAGPPQKRPGRV